MENEETNSVLTCSIDRELLQEQNLEESLVSSGSNSSVNLQDEKNELRSNSSEENSTATLTSASVPSETIKVYLRLKPFPTEIDLTKEQEDAYSVVDSKTLLTKFPGIVVNSRSLKNLKASERVCRTFTFTTAFGPSTSQRELFHEAVKLQLEDFLAGQNSTVMSYGTSNAGKSYTLYGVPSDLGIIPLSINFIFRNVNSVSSTPWYKPISQNQVCGLSSSERIRELDIRDKLLSFSSLEKTELINAYQIMRELTKEEVKEEVNLTPRQSEHRVIYSVWLSFAEIYNDAIYDLLSLDNDKKKLPLKMVTDKQGRTFIKDLRVVYVNSEEEAYQVLLAGQFKSRIAATTLNPRSSRSHCIFTIKLLKYYADCTAEEVEVNSLSFCDLAGSGRLKMSTNVGARLKETQNINTSLLVLGRCLKSIWEGQSVRQKSELVGPFRESKLTRLFQKALSGKERITLIVNVNPVPGLYAETQNVLNFSAIAKKIIVEPVKEGKKKIFTSRFSRVVSQSVKTITDWDHVAVEDSANEINFDKLKKSDYVLRECYDDLSAEYEKLQKEFAALKNTMVDKDLEIREEMANTYTGLINELEASWRNRSKDVEEQQEHLLAWSVNQVENFYKEKLNRLNSRKRRRWDDGDAIDDREADIRAVEAENVNLNTKIVVAKETIKGLRSARENAIAEKNKAVFELSLLREEVMGVKKMLEAAENDIGRKKDGTYFAEELKNQLNSREERIKNLKEFLNEAKEEYIRITSDANLMQEELKEANAALIENAEKIEDLEEQLEQCNTCLAERTKEVDQLTESMELLKKKLVEFEERTQNAENELKKSESMRLNLTRAVDDLNKLHKITCTRESQNFNCFEHNSLDFEDNNDCKNNSAVETTNIESENSLITEQTMARDRLTDFDVRSMSLESFNGARSIEKRETISTIDTDELVYKMSRKSFKINNSSGIDDSGIAITISSENQTLEQINCTLETDPETEEKHEESKIMQENERFHFDCLKDKVSKLEKQFSETNLQMETAATQFFNEQELKIERLETEVAELKEWYHDKVQSPIIRVDELKQKVEEFEKILAECQVKKNVEKSPEMFREFENEETSDQVLLKKDLLAASTPNRGSAISECVPNSELTECQNETSGSWSISVLPIEEKPSMIKEKLSDGSNVDSKPREILNVSKSQNLTAKRSEKLSKSVLQTVSPLFKWPRTFISDKSVSAPLMQSKRMSRNTKPLIQKNEVYGDLESKEELRMRNRKHR